MAEVITLTGENFEETLDNSKIIIVDFWAEWCGPCKLFSPIIEEIAAENDEIVVGKVNIDEEEDLAESFGIMSIPTLLVFRNGELCNKSIGLTSKKDVLSMIETCISGDETIHL